MTAQTRLLPPACLLGLLAACGTPEDGDREAGHSIAAMTTTEPSPAARTAGDTEAGFRTATFAVG